MRRPGTYKEDARPVRCHGGLRATWRFVTLAVCLVGLLLAGFAGAEERFPTPEFESGYELPGTAIPVPRSAMFDLLDVGVLAAVLVVGAVLAMKVRSRRALVVLMLFCLAYFGFWKKGCVCAVGSWQNVLLAGVDSDVAISLNVLAFFLLPLVFALFFGRVFCGAVCPLGAIQDIVVLHPIRLPAWLRHALGLIPAVFLGVGALLVYTGTGFLVCRADPFVGFFRLSGPTWILATGAILLAIGIFVARPYCRFLCPYGVLLGWASFLSRRKVTVTPDECVQCRLCEDVCPFDAIRKPTAPRSEPRLTGLRRLALILVLLPVMTVVGAWAGHRLSGPLSHLDKRVQLIDQLDRESETGFDAGFQVEAFRGSGKPEAELREEVNEVRDRFALGSILLGTFLGLTVGGRLTALCLRGERKDYEPDRSACLACGRCFEVCPREHQRRKNRGRAGKDA